MEDRELLELAAKALGKTLVYGGHSLSLKGGSSFLEDYGYWNPLQNDADALRLAIKLGISIVFTEEHDSVSAERAGHGIMIVEAMDDFGTRRAVVRAAAEIGRAKP